MSSDDELPDEEFTMAVDHQDGLGDHDRPGTNPLKRHWKTIAAASGLLLVGFSFLIVAFMDFGNQNTTRGIAFLVVGLLCAIPGGYQCYVLYQAWRRTPGYSFHRIPAVDEY